MKDYIGVVFYFLQILLLTRAQTEFSLSPEIACPAENVTFTCTVPGDTLVWVLPEFTIDIEATGGQDSVGFVDETAYGYILTITALNSTSISGTALVAAAAENGVSVSCLASNRSVTAGTGTIALADSPSLPMNIQHLMSENSTPEELVVSLIWDPPLDDGGRDILSYTVTISPPADFSQTNVTTNYTTFTANYSVIYTATITAINDCGFDSDTVEYIFVVCIPSSEDPPVSTGAAVGITFSLTAVFFTIIGILLGQIITLMYSRCCSMSSNQSEAATNDIPGTLNLEESTEIK